MEVSSMDNITHFDFESKSIIDKALKENDIKKLKEIIKKQTETISLYQKRDETYEQAVTKIKHPLPLIQKKLIINVPQSILNTPIGIFVQDFAKHHDLREGTILTSVLTCFGGFLQNIYKVRCQRSRESGLGLYYFGDTPPSTNKSPLIEILLKPQNNAIDFFNNDYERGIGRKHFQEQQNFPNSVSDVTAAGLEEYMQKMNTPSFFVQTTEKDFIASMLSIPKGGVSGFGMYLKAWRGEYHQSARGNRQGLNNTIVFGSILSLAQRGTVESILDRHLKTGSHSDGFEARCILTIEPHKREKIYSQCDFNYKSWEDLFYKYYLTFLTEIHLEKYKTKKPIFKNLKALCTNNVRIDRFIDYTPNRYETALGDLVHMSHMRPFVLKTRILIQKIAAILYALNEVHNNLKNPSFDLNPQIPFDYFLMADELVLQYVINHHAVYQDCKLEGKDLKKEVILKLFEKKERHSIRSICQNLRKNPCFFSEEKSSFVLIKEEIKSMIHKKELRVCPKDKKYVIFN